MEHIQEQILALQVQTGVNFASRTIFIIGDIEQEMACRVLHALEALDRTDGPIRILINSEGGEETDGYAIYDAITMCKNTVIIEGYGNILSAAAAIFQAGDIRRLSPNAVFLIHNGSIGGEDEMQQNTVIDLAEKIKKDNQKYYDILSAASQQPQDVVESWCREETYFTAKEALAAGFCDEIIKPVKNKLKPRRRKKKKG